MKHSPLTTTLAKKHAVMLAGTFLFYGLHADEIVKLLLRPGFALAHCEAQQEFFSTPVSEPMLYVLLRGCVAVTKLSGEGMLRMSELQPGAMFGMAALFLGQDRRSYPTHVQAKEKAVVLCITEQTLRELLREDARLMENYLQFLTGRIHFLNARLAGFIQPTAKERVLLYLRQNAKEYEFSSGLTALAQALGISRATLYRALDALELEGAIARVGRSIRITPQAK